MPKSVKVVEKVELGENKKPLTSVNQGKMQVSEEGSQGLVDDGKRSTLPDGLKNVDPTSVTEEEVRVLLNRSSKKY